MERAHLVRLEGTDDGVQHTSIMEEHQIPFMPVNTLIWLAVVIFA